MLELGGAAIQAAPPFNPARRSRNQFLCEHVVDELKILSAGAVKPGLTKVIDAFQRDPRQQSSSLFRNRAGDPQADRRRRNTRCRHRAGRRGRGNTRIRKMRRGRKAVTIGQIGVGVFVRDGEPLPQIGTVEGFKESLLGVESVVYNQASTGTYLETLFESLGIGAAIRDKSTRYPDFAAVLDHVSKGKVREIGLGATTVIIENEKRGVKIRRPAAG